MDENQQHNSESVLFHESYFVDRGDFTNAGMISSRIKKVLRQLGVPNDIIRMAAIASYEAELNLVIHSQGGEMSLDITPRKICLTTKDIGPGIADTELVMKEGYSTASESVRALGFGAGMGLPNIKRNSHEFSIASKVGEGTVIKIVYNLAA